MVSEQKNGREQEDVRERILQRLTMLATDGFAPTQYPRANHTQGTLCSFCSLFSLGRHVRLFHALTARRPSEER